MHLQRRQASRTIAATRTDRETNGEMGGDDNWILASNAIVHG
jgi:hypothetical protein